MLSEGYQEFSHELKILWISIMFAKQFAHTPEVLAIKPQ
jgi:hypothetical protein